MSTVGSAGRGFEKALLVGPRLFAFVNDSLDSLSIDSFDNFSSRCDISDILKYWPPDRTREPPDDSREPFLGRL